MQNERYWVKDYLLPLPGCVHPVQRQPFGDSFQLLLIVVVVDRNAAFSHQLASSIDNGLGLGTTVSDWREYVRHLGRKPSFRLGRQAHLLDGIS